MALWMGIDGGGSNLRVIIVDDDLKTITQVNGETVNPSIVGQAIAAKRIQGAMREALKQIAGQTVNGVGIGIAGAAAHHSADWSLAIVNKTLKDVPVVPSSDHEIALVGARGERRGILILAGTGSGAFGIDSAGAQHQIGGWGYLLGDEGSGYWIGLQALKSLTLADDGILPETSILPDAIKELLDLPAKENILQWAYGEPPTVATIARLAPTVLQLAAGGDAYALRIVNQAVEQLAAMAGHLLQRLAAEPDEIAFAGGLLAADNVLSNRLANLLGLSKRPVTLYSPVVGAALLAKLVLA